MGSRLFVPLLLLIACGGPRLEVTVTDVSWSLHPEKTDSALIELVMDLPADPEESIVVPSLQQAQEGALHVRFLLKDAKALGQRFRYMVYYRNETYAFSGPDAGSRSAENFYGGFTDGFHLSEPLAEEGIVIRDKVVIRADPREEYPGREGMRNPRTGRYSLLIVAIPEITIMQHPPPPGIMDTRLANDGLFADPYNYWLSGPTADASGVAVRLIPDVLALSVAFDLTKGMAGCFGDSAHFEPFLHYLDTNQRFANIPLVADVMDNAYTRATYDSLLCFSPRQDRVNTTPYVAHEPCANLRADSLTGAIIMRNPASTALRKRKEQTGIRTRHAFTYGRYRVHARLSPLLNDSDLWNGLTNAVWLIGTGSDGPLRRPCEGGYHTTGSDPGMTGRIHRSNYAEIDFEIMKGMPLCPERAFPPIYPQQTADANDRGSWLRKLPLEVQEQNGMVTVACTNWDLACPEPPLFKVGCQDILFGDQVFTSHRWDRDYRAITQKQMEADDVLFGPDGYWFEIDWRPAEIIWRIGPSPKQMRVVAYMNSTMTSIPDVPMRLVVTQEFHNTDWWPGCPYQQSGIPFPAKDLVGQVFSITIDQP